MRQRKQNKWPQAIFSGKSIVSKQTQHSFSSESAAATGGADDDVTAATGAASDEASADDAEVESIVALELDELVESDSTVEDDTGANDRGKAGASEAVSEEIEVVVAFSEPVSAGGSSANLISVEEPATGNKERDLFAGLSGSASSLEESAVVSVSRALFIRWFAIPASLRLLCLLHEVRWLCCAVAGGGNSGTALR